MFKQNNNAPKIRSIVIGVLAAVVFVVIFLSLGEVIKLAGAPFLYMPHQMGILQQVTPDEVQALSMTTPLTRLDFSAPGLYAVYTDDYDLLLASDDMAERNSPPWINVTSVATGEKIPAAFVKRGMRLYDTPLAKGRPIITFEISQPGAYEIRHPARSILLSIVPDYTTGREVEITLLYLIQLAIIALPLFIIFRRRRRAASQRLKEIDSMKRIQGEQFWDRMKK